MRIILDTSAWIEYLKGSKEGEIVNDYIKNHEMITPVVVLLELSYRADKEEWNFQQHLNFIRIKSEIVGVNELSILRFGKIYNEQRKRLKSFGFVDAIILMTALDKNAKIVTKDRHFKGLPEAVML